MTRTMGDALVALSHTDTLTRRLLALIDSPLLAQPGADLVMFWETADPCGLSAGERCLFDLAAAVYVGDTLAVDAARLDLVDADTRLAAVAVITDWRTA